jgi:hypothetical protein
MKTSQACLIVMMAAAGAVVTKGGDSRPINPQFTTVEIHTLADPQYGPIIIRATAVEDGRIEAISLEYKGKKVSVPAEGLADLKRAQIGTLSVTAVFPDLNPERSSLMLTMLSWDPKYIKIRGNPARVIFNIDNDEVVHRTIEWMTESGQPYSDSKVLKKTSAR